MLSFIQINLAKSRYALDLLVQSAIGKKADVLIVCEQPTISESVVSVQDTTRRAGIIIHNRKITLGDFKTTKFGFAWAEIDNIRIYSCYFSPNDSIEKFKKELNELEISLKTTRKELLIAGDFNGKSPEWGEHRADKRGDIVCEFVARNNLVILNIGSENTFRRGDAASIIDLTIGSTNIVRNIEDWKVLGEETLSDHQYIGFVVIPKHKKKQTGANRKNTGQPSWNVNKLNEDLAKKYLEEAKLINDLGWVKGTVSPSKTVKGTREIVTATCAASMPRRKGIRNRQQMYWWTTELAELRKECVRARRLATRSGAEVTRRLEYKALKKQLQKAIKRSKTRCWKGLLEEVENDPWGSAYKIVMGKLPTDKRLLGLNDPDWVRKIITDLFPARDHWQRTKLANYSFDEINVFSKAELLETAKKSKQRKPLDWMESQTKLFGLLSTNIRNAF